MYMRLIEGGSSLPRHNDVTVRVLRDANCAHVSRRSSRVHQRAAECAAASLAAARHAF